MDRLLEDTRVCKANIMYIAQPCLKWFSANFMVIKFVFPFLFSG